MLVLQRLLALVPAGLPNLPTPFSYGGWVLVVFGLAMTAFAARLFGRTKTNLHTFRDPNVLVTSGLFSLSRNPMYLGFTVALLGAAVVSNSVLALLPVAFFFAVANAHYIPFEEGAAEAQFGERYLDYKKRVRRWL